MVLTGHQCESKVQMRMVFMHGGTALAFQCIMLRTSASAGMHTVVRDAWGRYAL